MEFKFVNPEVHNASLYTLDQINLKYLFQNTFMNKVYSTLSKKTKLGEKEFIKLVQCRRVTLQDAISY